MTPPIEEIFNEEVRNLVGINERFENEKASVKSIRGYYGNCMAELCNLRDKAGRSEAGRNFAIAITELENSCMRSVKGLYSIEE